jgi:CBS domain containing-hemolysin-like protein
MYFVNASVSEDLPLYDILNEFQKGHSHMAVVIRQNIPNYPAKQVNNNGETLGELSGSSHSIIYVSHV